MNDFDGMLLIKISFLALPNRNQIMQAKQLLTWPTYALHNLLKPVPVFENGQFNTQICQNATADRLVWEKQRYSSMV